MRVVLDRGMRASYRQMSILTSINIRPMVASATDAEEPAMYTDTNIAAWMISGGPRSTDPAFDRNLAHLRALKASQATSPSLVSRLTAAVAAIRPASTPADPACCPA